MTNEMRFRRRLSSACVDIAMLLRLEKRLGEHECELHSVTGPGAKGVGISKLISSGIW
jgi:hypothetical protein